MSEQLTTEGTQTETASIDAPPQNVESTDDWGEDHKSLEDMAEAEALETLYPESDESKAGSQSETVDQPVEAQHEQSIKTDAQRPSQDDAYTPQEWAALNQVGMEIQQLRADEVRLQAVKQALANAGGDIVTACGGDRDRAAAFQTDLRELEKSVQARKVGEAKVRQHFSSVGEKKRVASGQAQLYRKAPNLKNDEYRKEFIEWGLSRGYTTEEISNATERDVLRELRIFEKDKASEPKKNFKVPKNAVRKSKMPRKQKSKDMTTEELFAEAGNPKPQTILYGLPERKKVNNQPPSKPDDPVEILYGGAA